MSDYRERWETLTVGESSMRAFLAVTDQPQPAPGLLVVQHAGGVDQFIQEMTRRLAAAGYAAIAPDLYHREDPQETDRMAKMGRLRDPQVIADCNAALDALQAGPAPEQPLAVVGFCMGGRVAYLMAAASDRLVAAVPFYGGNTRKAWGEGTPPFERLHEVGCPVLGFFGDQDANPSPADREAIAAELERGGVPHQLHHYAGAGHAYMDFTSDQRYHEDAATASWPLVLEFLAEHLGGREAE